MNQVQSRGPARGLQESAGWRAGWIGAREPHVHREADGTDLVWINYPGSGFAPAWSPDGAWLAFHYNDGGAGLNQIYLTRPGEPLRKAILDVTAWGIGINAVWMRR